MIFLIIKAIKAFLVNKILIIFFYERFHYFFLFFYLSRIWKQPFSSSSCHLPLQHWLGHHPTNLTSIQTTIWSTQYPTTPPRTSERNMYKCKRKFLERFHHFSGFSHIFMNIFFAFPTFRTSSPKKDIYYPSEPIEAECRVTGMPVPTVEWVHGTGSMNVSCPLKINFHAENSVNINRKIFFSQNNDFELNTIMEHSPSGIATVVARLIIKPHHVKPGTTKTFTCVGKSGAKIVKASSEFYLIKILIFLILELIPKFFREYFFIFLAF